MPSTAKVSEDEGAALEAETLTETLAELGIDAEDGTLILAREIARAGRGIQRVNGRATPLSTLQRIAAFLIDIHGQSAHLTILRPEQHVFYLDRYAATDDLRQQVTGLVGDWRAARRELERLQRDERELERQRELLQFQVEEIAAAKLRPGELEELERERKMLVNAERLGELGVAAHSALAGDETGEASGALDMLGAAQRALSDLLRLDDSLREQMSELEQALYLAEDVATSVRAYQENVAADPRRQAEVEERLDLLAKLRRKYGSTIEEVVTFGEEASRTLDTLSHREERIADLQQQEQAIRQRIGSIASDLSQRRESAGRALGAAMERELDDLNMQRARFQTEITQREDEQGAPAQLDGQSASWAFTATGIDYGRVSAGAKSRRATQATGAHRLRRRDLAHHARAQDDPLAGRRRAHPHFRRDRRGHQRAQRAGGWREAVGAGTEIIRCSASPICRRLRCWPIRTSASARRSPLIAPRPRWSSSRPPSVPRRSRRCLVARAQARRRPTPPT